MKIIENQSLKKFNTFGIDAKARYFVSFDSDEEIVAFVRNNDFAASKKLILNGGSNILFTEDFDGLVMKINTHGIEKTNEDKNKVWIKAKAGESWDSFVNYCIQRNYCGLENLSLIPGNVGSAPIQNIGAYCVEQKDYFDSLEALHINTGKIHHFRWEDCKFGYRESVFKKALKDQFIILAVTYKLDKEPNLKIEYGAIAAELEKMEIKKLNIRAISEAVCNIRRSKLPDPRMMGNAGSFFKNPIVDGAKYEDLKNSYPRIVAFPLVNNEYKIAAGWMIDQLGWKGQRRGDAGVCETQALVLVNYGHAKGSEILSLAADIQKSVEQTFGIFLEPEVNIIQ